MVKLRAYLSVVFSTVAITGAQSELTTFQVTSEESNIAKSVSMPSSVLRTDVQEQGEILTSFSTILIELPCGTWLSTRRNQSGRRLIAAYDVLTLILKHFDLMTSSAPIIDK